MLTLLVLRQKTKVGDELVGVGLDLQIQYPTITNILTNAQVLYSNADIAMCNTQEHMII